MSDNDSGKLKAMLLVAGIFCIAGWKSCTELRYTISGKTTEARVTKIIDAYEGRRSFSDKWAVEYRFKAEDGKRYRGRVDMNSQEKAMEFKGKKVEVIYVPGSPEISTMVGHRSVVWPTIFVVMSVFFGLSIWSFLKK